MLVLHSNGFFVRGKYLPVEMYVTSANPPFPGRGFTVDFSDALYTSKDVEKNLELAEPFGLKFPPPPPATSKAATGTTNTVTATVVNGTPTAVRVDGMADKIEEIVESLGGGPLYCKGQVGVLQPYVKIPLHDLGDRIPNVKSLLPINEEFKVPPDHHAMHTSLHHCSGRISRRMAKYLYDRDIETEVWNV